MSHPEHPIAFMSYVRADDTHEDGRLSEFCKRLCNEVRLQSGDNNFHIFQDSIDIAWGEQWAQRLNESLDTVTFLIPMITPGFFKSSACRAEIKRFIEREQQLGRGDLILPVYYVKAAVLDDPVKRSEDQIAQLIHGRNHTDWRELRHEPLTSQQARKSLAQMAEVIVEIMERKNDSAAPMAGTHANQTGSAPDAGSDIDHGKQRDKKTFRLHRLK